MNARQGGKVKKNKKKIVEPTFLRGNRGLPEMKAGKGNLEGPKTTGSFRRSAEVKFLHQTSKFWNRGPYY
jgi:hypothetical protein